MKLNIILLTAFAGCALARVVADVPAARDLASDADMFARDLAGADSDIFSRDSADDEDTDIGSRNFADMEIVSRDLADDAGELEAREPEPPKEDITRRCPTRKQASPFVRRGQFPFSTTRVIGFFFSSNRFNTVVLFFLFHPRTNDFFYTTNVNERDNAIRNLGYQNRGNAGWIFVNQRCGGSPLFRMFNPRRGQHFFTTSMAERANAKRFGWNDEGVTGFLFRF